MPNITGIPNVANPSLNVEETMNYKEDISKLSGKHAFKFGYDLMRLRRERPDCAILVAGTVDGWLRVARWQMWSRNTRGAPAGKAAVGFKPAASANGARRLITSG